MKKRDFKALVLMGIASGAMIASQGVEASESCTNLESTFAAGGGGCGAGGCGGAPNPQRGWGGTTASSCNAHSCNNQPGQTYRSRNAQQSGSYAQKGSRYSRQIAEGEETMPTTGDEVNNGMTQPPNQPYPPKEPKRGYNECNGRNSCNGQGKALPRQYRTRS